MTRLHFMVAATSAVIVLGDPKPCFSPAQWEGRQILMDPTNPDVVGTEYDIAYDAKFRRIYRHEHMPNPPNPNRTYYTRIELYESTFGPIFYEIDQKTKKCLKGKLTSDFVTYSVVDGSAFESTYYVGASAIADANLQVNSWSLATEKLNWEGVFTQADCLPVRFETSDKADPTQFRIEEFFDVTVGLHEPRIFSPPSQCPI